LPEYIARRIEENTLESLSQAVRLSPANGLAMARLARQIMVLSSSSGRQAQKHNADFYSQRAIELSPDDPEVRRIRAEIVE
jgi:hypothetical protein